MDFQCFCRLSLNYTYLTCRNFVCQLLVMFETTLKLHAFAFIVSDFSNIYWEIQRYFSAHVNIRQTSSVVRIPLDCVHLAEELALVAFWWFPRPLWFHATECRGAVGREPACVASKVCQLADGLVHARHAKSPAKIFGLLSSSLAMLSGEIYLRLKPYLVVEISSYIVTEHCCESMRSVYDVLPLRLPAMCWHGKWLRNLETPRRTMWSARPTWDITKLYFTFDFHILH